MQSLPVSQQTLFTLSYAGSGQPGHVMSEFLILLIMKQENIRSQLDKYGMGVQDTVDALRQIEYDYIQYNLSESIEEEAHVHKKLPHRLHCIHSLILIIEGK